MSIICIGDVMVDIGVALPGPLALGSDTPALITIGHGGSAANTAAWAASVGASAQFFGRVGLDLFGEQAEQELSAQGVHPHLSRDAAAPTGTCIVLVDPDGERTMIPSAGANAHLTEADLVEAAFEHTDYLHLSAYTLLRDQTRPAALAVMARAVRAGAKVSVDAASADPLRSVGAEMFLSWLPPGCLLIANSDESAVLSGGHPPAEAALVLSVATGAGVVVKCGADGAVVADSGSCVRVPAQPVAARDTTGAGDAFAAGLLVALAGGASLADAARQGNELASIAVAHWGPRPKPAR